MPFVAPGEPEPGKDFIINRREALALLEELRKAWVTIENQDTIYKMLTRLENELSS